MSELIGQRLGQYDIVSVLGEGGMAVVYRARQSSIERDVAIKVIKTEFSAHGEFMSRFKREAQVMALLSHPHIRKIFDYGQQNAIAYLVNELIEGETLAEILKRGLLSLKTSITIVAQIASALDYAHARGVVHRDLKPANVLIDSAKNVFLTDFGLAKLIDDNLLLTQSNSALGTPLYMAPEQWKGDLIAAHTDNYALAVMLFEMLTGQPPFTGSTHYKLMRQHLFDAPPHVQHFREDLPVALDQFFIKALAKEPDRRFQSALTMVETLQELLGSTVAQTPTDLNVHLKRDISDTPVSADTSPLDVPHIQEPTLVAGQLDHLQDEALLARTPPPTRRFINALPQDVSERYIGRTQQQADILTLISAKTRLISIYGRSGIGKTALVCKILSDLQVTSGKIYSMVTLSSTSTGISLERIIADFGKLFDEKTREALIALAYDKVIPPSQKVADLLEILDDGNYVLLLDNLETVQDPDTGKLTDSDLETFFEVALGRGSSLRLLVTSREPLSLPGGLKTWERLIQLETGLSDDESIALLRRFDPDGVAGLRDAPEDKLQIIASKTQGYPRALEAVAGLLLEDPLLSVEALITDSAALDSEIIPMIVQQAIDRLSPESLRIMEALALFERAVPQTAIEYLLSPYMEIGTLRATLTRLVKRYFVSFTKDSQTFALHPMDRSYCYARIPEGSTEDKTQTPRPYTRQALHYRAAEHYREQRKPQQQLHLVEDLDPHMGEVEHLMSAGDFEAAADLLLLYGDDYLHL